MEQGAGKGRKIEAVGSTHPSIDGVTGEQGKYYYM